MTGLLLVSVVLILVSAIAMYNALVSGRNAVQVGWSMVDVHLQRRHDLVPNLVNSVRGYMAHEKETLDRVTQARYRAMNAGGPDEKIEAENALTGAIGRLFVVSENYPELKAQETVSRLMEEIAATENRIAFARQHYNGLVFAQNNRIDAFPSSLIARRFGFVRESVFEIQDDAHVREAPVVSLS